MENLKHGNQKRVSSTAAVAEQGLNQFYDPIRTMYTGTSPLFDKEPTTMQTRENYLVARSLINTAIPSTRTTSVEPL